MTFKEYLLDYADFHLKKTGEALIQKFIDDIPNNNAKKKTIKHLKRIENGEKDLFF